MLIIHTHSSQKCHLLKGGKWSTTNFFFPAFSQSMIDPALFSVLETLQCMEQSPLWSFCHSRQVSCALTNVPSLCGNKMVLWLHNHHNCVADTGVWTLTRPAINSHFGLQTLRHQETFSESQLPDL